MSRHKTHEALKAPVIMGTAEILLGAADLKEVTAIRKVVEEKMDLFGSTGKA